MQRLRAAYRRARPWIPLVAAAAIALGASAAIGLTAIERASKGPAFRVSAACVRLNATVRQELGVVTGYGFTVQGPVVQNADGTGTARLDFSATGSWRSGHIHIRAVERHRRWQLTGPAELFVSGVRAPFIIDPDDLNLVPGPAKRLSTIRCAPTNSTTTFPRP
jgi:Cytochrome oxidase complex assembly protein 1